MNGDGRRLIRRVVLEPPRLVSWRSGSLPVYLSRVGPRQ